MSRIANLFWTYLKIITIFIQNQAEITWCLSGKLRFIENCNSTLKYCLLFKKILLNDTSDCSVILKLLKKYCSAYILKSNY